MRRAPRSETEPEFDVTDLGLVPVQTHVWGPMVWVNVDLDVWSQDTPFVIFMTNVFDWVGATADSQLTAHPIAQLEQEWTRVEVTLVPAVSHTRVVVRESAPSFPMAALASAWARL